LNTTDITIWLIKDAEPLPVDPSQRKMRNGLLADELVSRGYNVVWFASRFEHARKIFAEGPDRQIVNNNLSIELLDGPGYKRNISLPRIRHQRSLALEFLKRANSMKRPQLMVAAYPAPELCLAACEFAKKNHIPIFVDARDPWPDSFWEYFPKPLRFAISPVVSYFDKILRKCFSNAVGIISISNYMLDWALSYAGRSKIDTDKVLYLGYKQAKATHFAEVPNEFTAKTPLKIVFVGTFGKSYDLGLVLDGMQILEKDFAGLVVCRLVGDGQYSDMWRSKAQDISGVIFEGWKDGAGIEKILADSHVGLIPIKGGVSRFWIGNKLFEYTSHHLALINTAPEEVSRIIESNEIGFNLTENNPEKFAEIIKEYILNPNLLRTHRENAKKLFNESFDAKKIYSDYADHITDQIQVNNNVDQRAVSA